MMKTFRGFGRSLLAILSFIAARGKEPSTYATLTAALVALHVGVDPGALKLISLYGIAICGFLGVLLREAGRVNPFQVAADVADELRNDLKLTAVGATMQGVVTLQVPPQPSADKKPDQA